MSRFHISRPSPAMTVAMLALVVALAGSAYAVTKIGTKQLKNKAVSTKKIKNKAVTEPKIGDGAVGAGKIADGAVGAGKIADGAVTTGKLGDSAVTTAKLSDGAVGAGKIAAGAVGTAELGNGQVTAADLARPPRLIEYSQPVGTTDVPILTAGDLLLRADCTGAPMLLIEAATSSGAGTIESSGIAETEGGTESTFVNGPLAVGTSFVGATSISDADGGPGGADGNFELLYDGPGVVVQVSMTLTASNTASTDSCAATGIAVSAG